MKRTLTTLLIFFCLSATAQKDTTIQITLTVEQYRQFSTAINTLIDSKKDTKYIFDILDKGFKLIVADKPKEKPKQ